MRYRARTLVLAVVAAGACHSNNPGYNEGDDPCDWGDCGGGSSWSGSSTGSWTSSAPPDPTPVVLAASPPPPVSGANLLIANDGATAVAADPERDAIEPT